MAQNSDICNTRQPDSNWISIGEALARALDKIIAELNKGAR